MTVPQRLSFSAQLTSCNVGPCWQVMAQLSPPFIHRGNSFSGSIKLFHLKKKPLGWPWANLGRCLRNHRKTLVSTQACFRGKAFRSKQRRQIHQNKNDQWSSAARVSVSKCINPWYMTHSVLPFTIREPRQVCLNCL